MNASENLLGQIATEAFYALMEHEADMTAKTPAATLLDAQNAVYLAVKAERERIAATFDIPPGISGEAEDWSRAAAARIRGNAAP